MQISDIERNGELIQLLDDAKGGLWMRPITNGQAKEVRRAGRQASRAADRAAKAEQTADGIDPLDDEYEAAEERAAALRRAAEEEEAAMHRILFEDLVVDADGQRLGGDPKDASVALTSALWDRIEEVVDQMGKRRPTAKSGSGRKASSRKTSR